MNKDKTIATYRDKKQDLKIIDVKQGQTVYIKTNTNNRFKKVRYTMYGCPYFIENGKRYSIFNFQPVNK